MTTSQLAAFRAAVEQAALTAWSAAYPAEAFNFGNTHFDPTDMPLWASFSLRFGTGMMITMGDHSNGGANDLSGVVFIQIFVPASSGTGDLVVAADVMRDAFNRVHIGAATFDAPSVTQTSADATDPAWHMATVSCAFYLTDAL